MDTFIQIGLAGLVTSVLLLLIMFIRKYFTFRSILVCSFFIMLTCISGYFGLSAKREVLIAKQGKKDQALNNLIITKELLLEGQYDLASDIIRDMGKTNADQPDCSLLQARIKVLQGELREAATLYGKAMDLYSKKGLTGFPEDEYAIVSSSGAVPSYSSDPAMISFLNYANKDPNQYGFQPADTGEDRISREELAELVQDNIDSELGDVKESDEYYAVSHVGKMIGEVEEIYEDYLQGQEFDKQALDKLERKLSSAMEENQKIQGNKYARLARLKAMVLNENYRDIAASVDQYAGSEELMIVSELYMKGYVSNSSFSDEYAGSYDFMYEKVLEQCRKVSDQVLPNENKRKRRLYNEKIGSIKEAQDNKELAQTRRLLADGVHTTDPSLVSKEYLSLSKIENYFGNKDMADEYLGMAIGTVGNSDDENYTQPMYELIGIISGTKEDNSEDVKNIANYVDQVINNSMPIEMNIPENNTAKPAKQEASEQASNFEEYFANHVSEKKAMINIGVIDKSEFPLVKARMQVNSDLINDAGDVRDHIEFRDCNSPVEDLKVEPLEFKTSRIILLCDTSGSMSENLQDLNSAIIQFADEMNANEEISVVGFDSGIQFDTGFTSDKSEVIAAAGKIDDYGGTDMFSALLYAGDTFPEDVHANNIIILMTDGQDNDPRSEQELSNRIGALAGNKSVTVYTIGLGRSVDTDYLTSIARYGNGSFIYVDQASALKDFYDFIHQQLANQYVISYKAINRTLNERKLTASIPDETISVSKKYYLVDPELDNGSGNDALIGIDNNTQKTVYGLSTKFLYKSSKDQTITLKGKGFEQEDIISVTLTGTINYDLKAAYVDENTFSVLVPNNLKPEVYDVYVTLNTSGYLFEKELTIAVQGTEKKFNFGDYTFTALKSTTDKKGNTILSGHVIMNGWLYFKGDVIISGDYLNDDRVTVKDFSGAYISYNPNNSSGLAKFMAEKGISVSFAPLNEFLIYKDDYDTEEFMDFRTDKIADLSDINLMFFVLDNPYVCLYPDMLYFKTFGLDLELPFQKQLLRNFPDQMKALNLDRAVDTNTGMALTATNIGITGDFSYSDLREKDIALVNLPLNLDSLEASIDTIHNDYSLELKVKLKAWKEMESMGLGFEIKDGRFDGFSLSADRKVLLTKTPVPISMSNFSLGLSGFSEFEPDDSLLKKVLSTEVKAGFNMDFADASAIAPKLAEFIGDDVSVATLDDCEMKVVLYDISLDFTCKLKLFTVLNVGSAEINMGKFSYTNTLLGFNGITQYGLRSSLRLGSKWETANCYLDLDGTAELTLGYPYTGLYGRIGCDFEVSWWIFKKDYDVYGEALIGAFINSAGSPQFSMIVHGTNNKGKPSGFRLDISRTTGIDHKKY